MSGARGGKGLDRSCRCGLSEDTGVVQTSVYDSVVALRLYGGSAPAV